ncbi:MAG: hypothetical protein NT040_04060 [Bacteroidetes bacterium]|nr:hypothetical protein [Bacteroidota bacterium]
MKKYFLLLLYVIFLTSFVHGQVGINADGSQPDPSAMLDVKSLVKGILPPRVALTATNVAGPVTSPAAGLQVYNTAVAGTAPYNVVPGNYYWSGTRWVPLSPPPGVNFGDMLYWNGTQYTGVPVGLPGQFLRLSASFVPTWMGTAFATITTSPVYGITPGSAHSGGTVSSDGGSPVTARGICYSTSPNPTVAGNKTEDGSGTGTFLSSLTGLSPGTVYYLKAYATNGVGTSYGNEVSFITTCSGYPTVHVSIASTANPVCTGTPVFFTATPTNGGTQPGYQWKVNGINTGTNSSTYSYFPANNDVVTVVLTSSYYCTSGNPVTATPVTMIVNPFRSAGVSITPSGNPSCAGAPVTFTASPVNGGTQPGYLWNVNGINVGTNSSSYSYTPANNDVVSVILTSSYMCATGSPATAAPVTMTVNPSMVAGVSVASSASSVCDNTPVNFTATPVNGGTLPAYQWNVNGAGVTGATNATFSYIPANNDAVSCTMTSNSPCVTGNPATSAPVSVTVNPLMAAGVVIGSSGNPVCEGTSVIFTAIASNGGSSPAYQWQLNGSNIIGGTNGTYTYVPANNDAVSCIMTSGLPCSTGNPATSNMLEMVVNPYPVPSITGPGSVCTGSQVVYTTQPGMVNYTWSVSSGGTIVAGGDDASNTVTVTWNTSGNQAVGVGYTQSGCSSTIPAAYPVAVSPLPVPTITGPASVCEGSAGASYQTEPGMTGYTWTVSPGGTITSGGATSMIAVTWTTPGTKTITVNYTNAAGCAGSTAGTATVTVNPLPIAPSAGTNLATQNQVTWNWSSVPGATGYRWNTTNNYATSSDMGTTTTKTETGLACNTAYNRFVWAYNACGNSAPTLLTQTTLATPSAPVAGNHAASVNQITWTWSAVPGSTGFKWSTANNYGSAVAIGTFTTKTETGLTCNTSYTRYLWAYNACGPSAVTILTQSTIPCPPCPASITDSRDGKTYSTLLIGSQCWMKQNLNLGTRINGAGNQTNNDIIEKYCYNDLESNCDIYGGLYQWDEMMKHTTVAGTQGICLPGWHLPSNAEWTTLVTYLGGSSVAGGKMKEAGTAHWASPNAGATNSSGFTALPGGDRYGSGSFLVLTTRGAFWSSTPDGSISARNLFLYNESEYLIQNYNETTYGLSVRCVKDTCSSYSTVGVSVGASANPVCTGTSVTFSATPVNGGTTPFYRWKVNGAYVGINSANYTYTPSNGDSIRCILTSSASCAAGPVASNKVTMMVNTPQTPVISGTSSTCVNNSIVYTTQAGMLNYMWSISSGGTITAGGNTMSNTVTVAWNTAGTQTVGVSYTPPGCSASPPATYNVLVNPRPVPTITGQATACVGVGGIVYQTEAGMSGYTWTVSAGGVITSGEASNIIAVTWNTTGTKSVTVNYFSPSGCPALTAATFPVTVTPLPVAPSPGTHIATQVQITWNWNVAPGASGYKWNTTNDYSTAEDMGTGTSKTETGLTCSTLYARYVWAYSNCMASPVTPLTQATNVCCPSSFTDIRDGKTYTAVSIGNQCWMAQNLNLGTLVTGSADQTNNATFEKYCYSNTETNCTVYGGLYQWGEMVQYLNGASNTTSWSPVPTGNIQGICPLGWHLPTDDEWTILVTFLGGQAVAGGKMKEAGYAHWTSPNYGATNSSGFTALGAGERYEGTFYDLRYLASFRSVTEYSATVSWYRYIDKDYEVVNRGYNYGKAYGYSVRCLKD